MYPSTVFTFRDIKQDRYDYISCSTSKVAVPANTECVVLGTSFDPKSNITYLVVRPISLTIRLKLAPTEYYRIKPKEKL